MLKPNFIKVRADDAALKHNRKMMEQKKLTTIYVRGYGYEGHIVDVQKDTKTPAHEITFQYERSWQLSDWRTRREELK